MSERCVSSRTASIGEWEERGGGGGMRVAAPAGGMLAVVVVVVVVQKDVVDKYAVLVLVCSSIFECKE